MSSYDTLAASINALAEANDVLKGTVIAVQESAADARDSAEQSAYSASVFAGAAQQSAGIFPDTASGITATNSTTNKYFNVPGVDPLDALLLYRNVAGSPVLQTRSPSSAVAAIARRGNYILSGRATKVEKIGATLDYQVSWGRLYIFTGTGKAQAYVQPVTDLTVPDGKCAYVDLAEPLVGGEYVVHVSELSLLTTANPPGSYIDDSKVILFTCLNNIIGGLVAPQYHKPVDSSVSRATLALALQNTVDRLGWHIIGKATKLQPLVSTPTSYTVSFPELTITGGLTFASKKVAPVTDQNIANGEALYVDLDSAVNGSGQLVPVVTSGGYTAGMLTSGNFVTDRKVYLLINGGGIMGGPLAQQPIGTNFIDSVLLNRSLRPSYTVVGDLTAFSTSGSTCTLSFNDLRIPRGVGITTMVVAGMTDVAITTGQALFVDLSSALVDGKLVAQVSTNGYTSNAGNLSTGAFVDDTKVYLFINDTLGHAGILAGRKPSSVNVYMGDVWLKQAPCNITFDPTTRTLAWDNYLILPTSGGQSRVKLASGSYVFSNLTFNVAYLDLTAAVTTGDTPATAVKGGQYYDGTDADRFKGLPSQVPMFYWNGANDFGSLGGFPVATVTGSTVVSSLAQNDVVVKVGTGTVSVFVKGSKSGSTKYLEQTIGYENRPFDPTGVDAYGNSDLWHLKHQYECDITPGTTSFTRTRGGSPILNGGEIECAIKEDNKPDYIGGYHGDEIKTFAAIFIDGVKIPFDTVATYVGKQLTFVQSADLYRCNTQTVVAVHTKRVRISHVEGNMQIDMSQQVNWSQSLVLESAMLTMLPIKRKLNDTSGEYITDTAIRAPYLGTEDCSVTDFTQITTLGSLPDAQLWGPTGISASVEIIKHPGFADCGFYIASAIYYNKFYFSVAGSAVSTMGGTTHTTQPGEKWDVESVIRMTTNV